MTFLYRYLYIRFVAQDPNKTRVRWWGNSLAVLKSFPHKTQQNIGADLARVENKETPLDFKPLSPTLPGVTELRDRQQNTWYRLFYYPREAWIFVIHCFQKDSNKIPQREVNTAKTRIKEVNQVLLEERNAKQKKS